MKIEDRQPTAWCGHCQQQIPTQELATGAHLHNSAKDDDVRGIENIWNLNDALHDIRDYPTAKTMKLDRAIAIIEHMQAIAAAALEGDEWTKPTCWSCAEPIENHETGEWCEE